MSHTQVDHAESLALYERQTAYVNSIINQNPDYLNVLDKSERETFEKYFLPDWIDEGNFARYYEKLEQEEPKIIARGNKLLQKFMKQNGLEGTELIMAS